MTAEIWRRLTAIDGMTARQLAEATGLPVRDVRAELNRLQKQHKVARWEAPVGKSDLWWRWEQRPISDHTIMLALALALDGGKPERVLRNIMLLGAKRGWTPGLRFHMARWAKHKSLHPIAADLINFYRAANNLPAPGEPKTPETIQDESR